MYKKPRKVELLNTVGTINLRLRWGYAMERELKSKEKANKNIYSMAFKDTLERL